MKYTLKSILVLGLYFAIVGGYILNIYKLFQCDFEPNYREETIRTCGVFCPPLGVFIGYISLNK
jgi:hypothetical protein